MMKNWKKQQNRDKKEQYLGIFQMKVYSLSDEAVVCIEFSRLPVFREA